MFLSQRASGCTSWMSPWVLGRRGVSQKWVWVGKGGSLRRGVHVRNREGVPALGCTIKTGILLCTPPWGVTSPMGPPAQRWLLFSCNGAEGVTAKCRSTCKCQGAPYPSRSRTAILSP